MPRSRGFSLIELLISLAVIVLLLGILIPTLTSARRRSECALCAAHLRAWGMEWTQYLKEHDGAFPYVPIQPEWRYAGVRFSSVDGHPFVDSSRPLSSASQAGIAPRQRDVEALVNRHRCPADSGITGATTGVGTGRRTAFAAFGISYRANEWLLDAGRSGRLDPHRGLNVAEIFTAPSRLVVMGDPVWYEVSMGTGRRAAWHGEPDRGNLLFVDGSVRFSRILPRAEVGPVVFQPRLAPEGESEETPDGP